MSTFPTPKVGDTLIQRRTQGGRYETTVTVTKVARKWGYVDASRTRFDITTGYADGGQYLSPWRLLTPEMDAAEKAHSAAADQVSAVTGYGWMSRVSTETLTAIALLIAGDES